MMRHDIIQRLITAFISSFDRDDGYAVTATSSTSPSLLRPQHGALPRSGRAVSIV